MIGPIRHATPVEERPLAPGQLKHHYAPRKPLRLVRDDRGRFRRERISAGWLLENLPPMSRLRA